MGEEWILLFMIGLRQVLIRLHIAIGEMYWNLCDYPLLQHSKGIIIMCMIIFIPY